MAQMTRDELGFLIGAFGRKHLPAPRVCVETGAFQGHFTVMARDCFQEVHSIELSGQLVHALRLALPPSLAHQIHHGDSRQVLPFLAEQLRESVAWFFDANWWRRPAHLDPGIAGAQDEYPLWDELLAVQRRTGHDIIMINEFDTFGQLSAAGRDRRDVTLDRIRALFARDTFVIHHNILAIYR